MSQKFRGSVAQAGLHTHPREKKYGNLWNQIDFEIEEGLRGDGKDGYNNTTNFDIKNGDNNTMLLKNNMRKCSNNYEGSEQSANNFSPKECRKQRN